MATKLVGTLLVVVCLFQGGTPQGPTQDNPTTPAKKRTVHWGFTLPFVGCDGSTPITNIELPEANVSTTLCAGKPPLDTLPQSTPKTAADADTEFETGTVIVVSVSHDKITVAADSRNVLVTTREMRDGTRKAEVSYDDGACKLTQLTPTLLFAADGQVSSTNNALPSSALYDAHKLALLAARNYHSNPDSDEERDGGMIHAIAIRWAWDVDLRMRRAMAKGWKPIQTLEGIFLGLEPNGETAMVVAKIKFPNVRTGSRIPPVTFTVNWLNPPPNDFTYVQTFGMKDVAESYYPSSSTVTDGTKPESEQLRKEMYVMDPKEFSQKIPERLVDLTVQHYQTLARPDELLYVHGPIDSAVLERNKTIKWVHQKTCSAVN
jgi:hypothetical protein